MNRRATLMLAIGGFLGMTSPSVGAGSELHKKRSNARASTASSSEGAAMTDAKPGSAPLLQNLKEVGPDRQVASISHNQNTYTVTTADGRSADFWESNLRFKIDSSESGPMIGKPAILATGMMGDRASVIFASPAEISNLIKRQG